MTTLFDKMVLDRCDDDEPLTAWMPERNAQIPEPLRSIVNAASPAVKPMEHRACWLCDGSGYRTTSAQSEYSNHDMSTRCSQCAGRGYVTVEGQ